MTTTPIDRRERRWAFMSRKVIGRQDNPMLIRWRLLQTPWFGIYLHFIHREDLDRAPHDHPWTFWTWVIRGHYLEEFWPDSRIVGYGRAGFLNHSCSMPTIGVRQRWSFRRFPLAAAHRITSVHGKVTTLVLVGPKSRTWGFYDGDGAFVDWRDYVANRNGWSDEQRAQGAPS